MRFILLLLLFTTFGTYAQEVNLQFSFKDAMTNAKVDSVELFLSTTNKEKLLNKWIFNNENVEIDLPNNQLLKVHAEKEGYFPFDTLVNLGLHQRTIKRGKTIELPLTLRYDGQFSEEFNVSGTYEPEIAFSSERISVSDFVVLDKETMVLLAYPKRLNAGSELIWFKNDQIVSKRKVPGKALRLDVDYRNRIYLRCEYTDYMLKEKEQLKLVIVQRDELDNFVRPILDTLENKQLFYTTYKDHYPAFDFFKVEMNDTTNSLLHHIEDTEMMEHYRAEYKWVDVRTKLWAWNMEAETGIDREVWVGANVFTNSIYYEAPYSEFFLVEDKAYVFDFYKDFLYTYDADSGEKQDSVAIDFHKNTKNSDWKSQMYQDPITKKIYTFYDDAGYTDVFEINLENGKKENKFTLFYRYIENIQLYDNEVFYIYRPFESLQKKYLYRESFEDTDRSLAGQNRFEELIKSR